MLVCAEPARPIVQTDVEFLAWLLVGFVVIAAVTAFVERRADWVWQRRQAARPVEDDRSSLVRHRRHLDAQRVRQP